jgi:UDP-N-acetylmuramoylalanine--D-glutamate ligase
VNHPPLKNNRITVAGLGRFGGGIAVARWLVAQGARVLVTDKEPAEKLVDSLKQLDGLPIEFRLGEHRESDFTSVDLVVPSPAVPPSSPYLVAAQDAGVPIKLEIALFLERCPARVIGVTATKGKSTTTTLLGLMLRSRFPRTFVGGNIGGSLLFELPRMTKDDLIVLELSSYMLHHLRAMQWSPHVAVVGMIGADHLEWHGGREAYVDAKRNLVRFQTANDHAVLNEENDVSASFADHTKAKVVRFGTRGRRPIKLGIAGSHNLLNAQAAFAAADVLGVTFDEAQAAVEDFHGLPHRLQVVHESRGVRYVNDSIATIPEAAIAALDSFPPKSVIQIVGGYDSHVPLEQLAEALAARAKAALCIGATGPQIADLMSGSRAAGRAAVYHCGDLGTAVKRAQEIAGRGDVVLLSTGCKSYDQFTNFEQRGDRFTDLARSESGSR